jgi:hypothetical protein
LKLNPLVSFIEQVKQPSPSTNPANQASFKVGRIDLFINLIGSNKIRPLVTHKLNASTKIANFSCLLGNTKLPLIILIIRLISTLLCITYLKVIAH